MVFQFKKSICRQWYYSPASLNVFCGMSLERKVHIWKDCYSTGGSLVQNCYQIVSGLIWAMLCYHIEEKHSDFNETFPYFSHFLIKRPHVRNASTLFFVVISWSHITAITMWGERFPAHSSSSLWSHWLGTTELSVRFSLLLLKSFSVGAIIGCMWLCSHMHSKQPASD